MMFGQPSYNQSSNVFGQVDCLQENVLVQRGNKLSLNICVKHYAGFYKKFESKQYQIKNSAFIQFVVDSYYNQSKSSMGASANESVMFFILFLKFAKLNKDDGMTYTLKLSSSNLQIQDKCFTSDDGTLQYVHSGSSLRNLSQSAIYIAVVLDVVPRIHPFPTLYDDDMTDIELCGDDGSIKAHKVVLAACSPVMKTMFCGNWRELSEGKVDLPGISKKTLQQLKDYMYLHALPESGLERLLLLASNCMMPDLEQKCVDKLVDSLNAKNYWEIFEFTVKNKMMNLLVSILENVDQSEVKQMRQQLLTLKISEEVKGRSAADTQDSL